MQRYHGTRDGSQSIALAVLPEALARMVDLESETHPSACQYDVYLM